MTLPLMFLDVFDHLVPRLKRRVRWQSVDSYHREWWTNFRSFYALCILARTFGHVLRNNTL